jgi:meiotically up-regulated gene 157 (Mug157) protein
MVKSAFRPSDDSCVFPYFVPGNAMVAVNLQRTSEMIQEKNPGLSSRLLKLSKQIKEDIYLRGTTKDANGK